MRSTLSRNARSLSSLLSGPVGPVPTPDQLVSTAMRYVASVALVLLAAGIVHRTGHLDQQWQYVAIAGSLVPQMLLVVLATQDAERRARLRTSTRPAPLQAVIAGVLVVAAAGTLLAGSALAPALAALAAATGLAVAAAPVTVTFAPRG